MSRLREQLAEELAAKVDRYGVVVWSDPQQAYSDIVRDVAPNDAKTVLFRGSWLDLRRQVEDLLVGDSPPRLVVYLSDPVPDPDPLAEVRSLGADFRVLLGSLTKRTLSGEVTETRIGQLAQQCTTLSEVDAALAGGDSSVDARLISLAGEPGTAVIAEAILAGNLDDELAARGLWSAARGFFEDSLGDHFNDLSGEALRAAVVRRIVLLELVAALDPLPDGIAGTVAPHTTAHRRAARSIVQHLRSEEHPPDLFADLARAAEDALHLGATLQWKEGLAPVDITPVIEQLAIDTAIGSLDAGDHSAAADLAEVRLAQSWWVRGSDELAVGYASMWRAVRALAELAVGLEARPPEGASFAEILGWYAEHGWRADAAFRQVELIRVTAGLALDELDEHFHTLRNQYEEWLDGLIHATTTAVADDARLEPGLLQRTIHDRAIRSTDEPTALILVDALRFELGCDLASRLGRVQADVDITYAVATPPTITPVGMAAVLPGAASAFRVEISDDNKLNVAVGGTTVRSVPDRVHQLEVAHGQVASLDLDWLAQARNSDIKKKTADAGLVLVRSTEIDADGESDHLAASWGSFDGVLNVLHTAVAKLLHCGILRVVITADHGFLAVRRLGDDRKLDKPATGSGELHRRAWIGRGGTATDDTVKVALAEFGIGGDLDIISPQGLGVFTSGGGLQFFHGGLSPQELVIPQITVTSADTSVAPHYRIDLSVAGDQITTGIVAVTVEMHGDLFTRESGVRLQLSQHGRRVARTTGGDGVDFATAVIDASVDAPRVITLQVTEDLTAGSSATLEVLDAATGVRLGDPVEVEIAANVLIEDEL